MRVGLGLYGLWSPKNCGVRAVRARFIAEDRYKPTSDVPVGIEWVVTAAR